MANIEDAERCIDIAVVAMNAGDRVKADRFLQKSLRLHATPRAEKLLLQLHKPASTAASSHNDDGDDATDENASPNGGSRANQSEGVRFRGTTHQPRPEQQQQRQQHKSSPQKGRPPGSTTSRDPDNSESSPGIGTGAAEANYTAEQAREVDRIMKAKKNFYQVLQVEQKNFALIEVKKSYRKLALIVHPDKNKAPHASEAFKVVGHAYATLSDSTKKNHYDHLLDSGRLDEDDEMSSAAAAAAASRGGMHASNARSSAGSYSFDYDDPDEIFRMFFGFEPGYIFQRRAGQAGRTYVYRQPQHVNARHRHGGGENGEAVTIQGLGPLLLQLAPVLLLIIMSLLGQLFSADADWSFAMSDKHTVQMQTSSLQIKFYVRPRVPLDYSPENLRQLEATVESAYINGLREACIREKHQRESMIWRAKMYADRKMYDRAKEMSLPSCVELNKIYAGEG